MRTSSFNNMRAANAAAFQSRSTFGNHATLALTVASTDPRQALMAVVSAAARLAADSTAARPAEDSTALRVAVAFMVVGVEAASTVAAAVLSAAAEVVDTVAAEVVAEEAITNRNFDCNSESRRANRRFSDLCAFCVQSTKDGSHRFQRNCLRADI